MLMQKAAMSTTLLGLLKPVVLVLRTVVMEKCALIQETSDSLRGFVSRTIIWEVLT